MQKKILLLLFGLIAQMCIAQKDVTIPETISFDTGVGSESSVNQSNGKLNIGLSLVSIDGYKDLSASFGIAYDGNNITKTANASNKILPTGVLGLGWGMSFPRVLADNKLTATRDDDQFYLYDNGLVELIAIEKTSFRYTFKMKKHKPWKIFYYPTLEKWEVIKENGYKFTYANVDWSIYWDNWIGDSNQSNGNRQGHSWNLTKAEDLYGNKIEYEYINVEQSLKNTGIVKHTEATYLNKIIGPCGEEIRLIYNDKLSIEYFEPNTNQIEPDAYQESYETKYLKWVEAYDTTGGLLYKYKFDYDYLITGNGEFRKRILDEITLINTDNESQFFRAFEYDTNPNSDFYGNLIHQILPSQGRVSYQYQINEIEIDQILNESSSSSTNYIVHGNYIIKTGTGKIYTWNGVTWEEQSLSFGLNELQLIYKENFIAALWKQGNVYKSRAYGLKDDGYTWELSPYGTQTHGVSSGFPKLVGGNDFYAIGYPREDKLYMYRWDGVSWHTNHQISSNTGRFFYGGTNNYVIQNRRAWTEGVFPNQTLNEDYIKLHYYDVANNIQTSQFNLGIYTNGSQCQNNPNNCPGNYFVGQNSFTQMNANGNPEYLITWDKNYNFLNKVAPFGQVLDHFPVFGVHNNTLFTFDETYNKTHLNRYIGNSNWITNSRTITGGATQSYYFGVKNDFFVHHSTGQNNTRFLNFNANTQSWQSNDFQLSGGSTQAFDFFGREYAFAYSKVFRINSDLSINQLSNSIPTNILFAKSDGENALYLVSLSSQNDRDILSVNSKNEINQYNLPNGWYLKENDSDRVPKYPISGGSFVLRNNNNNNSKIYKLINDEINLSASGKGIYKDIVVAKEVFDPVLTRKQRTYYCYSNPKISNDNMRVYYSQVSQQNDLDGVLGKTVTFYDAGTDDVRKTGLPNKVQIYDAQNNLVSEQKNTWRINQLGESYYINLDKKFTRSIENTQEIVSTTFYEYDLQTGLQKKIRVVDSEGNEEVNTNYYLFEEYPQIADTYNLLSPVIVNKSYFTQEGSNQKEYKSVTAVKWSTTGIPEPKISYYWNGANSSSEIGFNFSGSNPDFLISQNLSKYDTSGNLLEEKNRSSVITSYIYGYDNKRIVAKVEGATHNQAIGFVSQSILNNPSSDAQLRTELQKIRDGVPNAFVSSYTYNPSIGLTSMTDPRGRTQYYHYDSFYRLDYIVNNDNEIVSRTNYNYREAPFNYEPESTQLPDCELINTQISNDPSNTDPLTLSISVLGTATNQSVSFKAMASDGGVYNYNWNYQFTNPSDESYFDIDINDNVISFSNNFCSDGTFTVWAEIQGYTPLITSNNLGHTFTSTNTDPNAIDCFEN